MAVDLNRQPGAPRQRPTDEEMAERRRVALERSAAMRAEFRNETVQFGSHPKQVLHILYPKQAATAAPVFVFLHGGGFRNGDPEAQLADGRAVLEGGAIFVSMGYRLLPETRFPECAIDVDLGLTWLHDNLASRGGDPARIWLSGHSAGAMLAAMVGFRSGWTSDYGLPADVVKGMVLISGFYDYTHQPDEQLDTAHPQYVPDLTKALQRTPPTIIVVGEHDMPPCMPNGRALETALRAKGGAVEFFVETGADHFRANQGLLTQDGAVYQATKRLMGL